MFQADIGDHGMLQVPIGFHERKRLVPQQLSFFGQGEVIAGVLKQNSAAFFLKLRNILPDGLPGHIDMACSAGVIELLAHREEDHQLLQGHTDHLIKQAELAVYARFYTLSRFL